LITERMVSRMAGVSGSCLLNREVRVDGAERSDPKIKLGPAAAKRLRCWPERWCLMSCHRSED
jgi:hypothetical protein